MASENMYVTTTEFELFMKDYKKMQRLVKKMQKQLKPPVDEDAPKRLNGFAKPTQVSKEMRDFMGLQDDEMVARTQVTKFINGYVKENKLQNTDNKRIINMDDKLKSLIDVPTDVDLTFFNLQKYIKHHYVSVQPSSTSNLPEEADSTPQSAAEPSTPEPSVEQKPKVLKKRVKK